MYRYNEVAIFIEKGAKVSDLIILDQFFRLHNHVNTFILVTKCTGLGTYEVIVDKRVSFYNDLQAIRQLMDNYFENRTDVVPPLSAKPPLPPLPEVSYENGLEYFIDSKNGDLILIENLKNYQVLKSSILESKNEIILKLSSDMTMEDYLLILNDIQELRVNFTPCFDQENEPVIPRIEVIPSILDRVHDVDSQLNTDMAIIKKVQKKRAQMDE